MARVAELLSAVKIESAKQGKERPGLCHDGGGLYLKITSGGASWVLRYMLHGKARYMGLGPVTLYGLADARQLRLKAAKSMTFKSAAEACMAAHGTGKAVKTKDGWKATLVTHAEPVMLPVQTIDTALVLKVLEPIWTKKPEMAGRVRQRIGTVLDWGAGPSVSRGGEPRDGRGI